MGEVWATFSVKDHLRNDAFVREVLLFDRLVIPYPMNDQERERWKAPNPRDTEDSWKPDRLDEMLRILGTQRDPEPRHDPLAWCVDWSQDLWRESRRAVADQITERDAFYATRLILAMDESLPKIVEAVAAYPSHSEWVADNTPSVDPPPDLDASTALLALTCPLLVPDIRGRDPLEVLSAAAALSRDPDFRTERDVFYRWLRDYLAPLQAHGTRLTDLGVDANSVTVMRQRLQSLLNAQHDAAKRCGIASWWDRAGAVCVVVAAAAAVVAAAAAAPPLAAAIGLAAGPAALISAGSGVGGTLVSLAGWAASRRAELPAPRPLDGASMFLTAAERLGTGATHS